MTALNRTRLVGGAGGHLYGPHLLPEGARLTAIYVHSGDCIDGLQLEYTAGKPSVTGLLPFIGGVGGTRHEFRLPPREKILAISGCYSRHVNCLRFHTNRGASPLFGLEEGEGFMLRVNPHEKFCGLFGRAGWFLDSVGLVQASSGASLCAVRPRRVGQALAGVGRKLATEWIDPILEVPRPT